MSTLTSNLYFTHGSRLEVGNVTLSESIGELLWLEELYDDLFGLLKLSTSLMSLIAFYDLNTNNFDAVHL